MWHWNSLWARAPGDPLTIDDPTLWQSPWSPEQALALQARGWEAALSASHAWWTCVLSVWPLPTWPGVEQTGSPAGALFDKPAVNGSPLPAKKRARPSAVSRSRSTKAATG